MEKSDKDIINKVAIYGSGSLGLLYWLDRNCKGGIVEFLMGVLLGFIFIFIIAFLDIFFRNILIKKMNKIFPNEKVIQIIEKSDFELGLSAFAIGWFIGYTVLPYLGHPILFLLSYFHIYYPVTYKSPLLILFITLDIPNKLVFISCILIGVFAIISIISWISTIDVMTNKRIYTITYFSIFKNFIFNNILDLYFTKKNILYSEINSIYIDKLFWCGNKRLNIKTKDNEHYIYNNIKNMKKIKIAIENMVRNSW